MSATKNVNQSSPRRLVREGFVGWSSAFKFGCMVDTGTSILPPSAPVNGLGFGPLLLGGRRARFSRRHRGRGPQDDDLFAVFVLGSSLYLGPCQVHHDAVRLLSRSETQNAPVDRNLPAPDP